MLLLVHGDIYIPERLDIQGQRFGRLIAIEYGKDFKWTCICDCGNTTFQKASNLTRKHVISCGCANRDRKRFALSEGEAALNKVFNAYSRRNKNMEHF